MAPHLDVTMPKSKQALPVEVHGERFAVEIDEGAVYLTHPRWSLVGSGTDLVSARQDLLDEARQLAGVMQHDDVRTLTPDAVRMREFVLRLR